MGPPVRQPYLDLLKLLGKEDLEVSDSPFLRWGPQVALAAVLLAALLVPMGILTPPLGMGGDSIAFIYAIGLAAMATVLTAAATASPYASVGLGREVIMMLTAEPVVVIALITAAVSAGSFRFQDMVAAQIATGPSISMAMAGLALFLALQAQAGKLPFDVAEADQEIMGGTSMELSGPKLALFKWAMWAKFVIFASILCQIFVPWPYFRFDLGAPALALWVNGGLGVIANLVKVLVVAVLVSLVDVVSPRVRIDQSINIFVAVIFIALFGLAFGVLGR
jgi:formate hydrogenlyase subunit 4